MQEQIKRIDNRLARMEKLLIAALAQNQVVQNDRLTEKEVMEKYAVSKTVLRRLRLGYKRYDGVDVPPLLFKWKHRNGRFFDYDREEVDKILARTHI